MTDDFTQCHISKGLDFFRDQVLSGWNCQQYYDPHSPAIFLGIYFPEDLELFINHKAEKILLIGGSDYGNVKYLKRQKNAFSPVFTGFMDYHISKTGIKCKPWPVSVRDFTHIPSDIPLGDKIYIYSGNNERDYLKDDSGLNKGLYNECIAPLIEELGEDKFIFAKNLSMEDLIEKVYKHAYIFIKPNEFGGTSAMWELAHMGRKTIASGMFSAPNICNAELTYNKRLTDKLFNRKNKFEYPTKNVIGYENIDHVIALIKKEEAAIGSINQQLTSDIKSLFSNLPWKKLDFWEA